MDQGSSLPASPGTCSGQFPGYNAGHAASNLEYSAREAIVVSDGSSTITTSVSGDLAVTPLEQGSEEIFTSLYETSVRPFYCADTLDYAPWVLRTHFKGFDPYGYFTRRKTVWLLYRDEIPIGFIVATEKRGGSVKFGPSALQPNVRGQGLGTRFRLLVERQYPRARKFYNTLPERNSAALRYIVRAGYRVEAHLRQQYSPEGELVVGKLLTPKSPPPVLLEAKDGQLADPISILSARHLTLAELNDAIVHLLPMWYSEIDGDFVRGVFSALQDSVDFSHKSKAVGIAFRSDEPVGLVIVTPKRGGALKCSPIVARGEDPACFRSLLDFASASFPHALFHKHYLHLPLICGVLIADALFQGFVPEGLLIEPYKQGLDMIVLARMVR